MNMRTAIGTLLAAATLLVLGCSGSSAGVPESSTSISAHPSTWIQDHWTAYLQNPTSCTACHGSTVDQSAAGGISKVSCFGCHHPNGPHHAAGWFDPATGGAHGRQGAQAAPNGQFGFLGTGFAACMTCHGTGFANPVGVTPSCMACHTHAPHPDKPWSNGADPTQPTHDQTDQGNVPVCAQCHLNGANSDLKPSAPAPAGTAPGCFNGTLCHSTSIN